MMKEDIKVIGEDLDSPHFDFHPFFRFPFLPATRPFLLLHSTSLDLFAAKHLDYFQLCKFFCFI